MEPSGIDLTRMQGLLERLQTDGKKTQEGSPAGEAFQALLKEVSDDQKGAAEAATRLITTGEGQLHDVQIQLAKADIAFRFLVEVRNKLTDAYQEITRLSV